MTLFIEKMFEMHLKQSSPFYIFKDNYLVSIIYQELFKVWVIAIDNSFFLLNVQSSNCEFHL